MALVQFLISALLFLQILWFISTIQCLGNLPGFTIINRRLPEITGEIIRKSEAPVVGHHFRHGLLAYIGPWFQNEGGSRKALVCDSIRPSGMDLYYTGLSNVCYVLETLLFSFHILWSFWRGHMWCVCLEWRTDWIDCERSLFTLCSWLRRRN